MKEIENDATNYLLKKRHSQRWKGRCQRRKKISQNARPNEALIIFCHRTRNLHRYIILHQMINFEVEAE
jgi:hypothetical protein